MRPDTAEFTPGISADVTAPSKTHANLEDLLAMATQLDHAHDACQAALDVAQAIYFGLPEAARQWAPAQMAHCEALAGSLTYGPTSLSALVIDAHTDANRARRSEALYSATERSQAFIFDRMRARYSIAMTNLRLIKLLGGGSAGGGFHQAPDIANSIVELLDAVLPGSYEDVVGAAGTLGWSQAASGKFRIAQIAGPESPNAPTSVYSTSGAAGAVADLYRSESKTGHTQIQIQRTVDPLTGAGRWIVMTPGTQSWAPGATMTHDGQSNFELAAGRPSASAEAVATSLERAMRAEGVDPHSEPVMVVDIRKVEWSPPTWRRTRRCASDSTSPES